MLKTYVSAACVVLFSASANAATFDLPAGLGCDFHLLIEITGNPNRVTRTFTDKSGNPVRMLTAGRGDSLTFTNVDSGATLALRPNGSVQHVDFLQDGSQRYTTTGHNVLVLFPSDIPAGPTTTLYVGQSTFTIDATGVFTLGKTTGKSSDICAALSS